MHTFPPDLRSAPRFRSPGVLVAVVLAHAVLLALLLTRPRAPQPLTPPVPLSVRLIQAAVEQPAPAPASPQPPQPVLKQTPPPVLVTTPPIPQPAAAPAPQPRPAEPPAEVSRAEPTPAPAVVETPRPAPPAPLVQPRFNADYLDNPKPVYPGLSRRMGEEGEVRLRVYVDAAGNPQQVEIERSSGYPRLDQAALETVKRWRFVPARQGDQPVAAWVIVPIQFTLRS